MRAFLLVSLLTYFAAKAGINQAPPTFFSSVGKTVFVDFQTAHYKINYDVQNKKAWVDTTIRFKSYESGYPIFDSVHEILTLSLNGQEASSKEVSTPGGASKVRVVEKFIEAGENILKLKTPLYNGTKFKRRNVSSGFFIKDLTDRKFLERFIPSNYEYDQYKMDFEVKVLNSRVSHRIFANAQVEKIAKNHFSISYPAFYTSSSLYFHIVPRRKFRKTYFTHKSIDGREIPVTIYSRFLVRNWRLKAKAKKILAELEHDYGPWPHPSLLIYGTKLTGGMEYVGATATSVISLGHEMQHSYFAKGVMPANGNSGWMDEAIASWRDKGHQTYSKTNYSSVNLARHNVYTRKTDDRSYKKGRSFMAYLDYQLKALGKDGLKDFLRGYFNKRKFTTVTTKDFIYDLEAYAGHSFYNDFERYVFGEDTKQNAKTESYNPHHPPHTQEQLDELI